MPAGRPRKDKNGKLVIPMRVEHRSEEYYLERALQTVGLLTGENYIYALKRLMEIRTGTTIEAGTQDERRKSKRLTRKLAQILGQDTNCNTDETELLDIE